MKELFLAAVLSCFCCTLLSEPGALFAQSLPTSSSGASGTATVTGKIVVNGSDGLKKTRILFYSVLFGPPRSRDKYTRIPDVLFDAAADGTFTVQVPAGTYYIGAISRNSGESFGPPRNQDRGMVSRDISGKPLEYTIPGGARLDIGTITADRSVHRTLADRDITAIQGTITDAQGNPVENMLVFAFMTASRTRRPIFVSERSDTNGRYLLRVTEGTYYLRLRSDFGGGPPSAGQVVDSYGQQEPASVSVKSGEIRKDIDLKAVKFPGRGPLSTAGPGQTSRSRDQRTGNEAP